MSASSSWDALAERLGKEAAKGATAVPDQAGEGKKGPGRPKGLYGSRETRTFLKAEQQSDPVHKGQVTRQKRGGANALVPRVTTLAPFEVAMASADVQSSVLQTRVCLFATQQAKQEQDDDCDNPALKYLFSGRRAVATLRATVGSEPIHADTVAPRRIASVLVQSSGRMWNCFLEHLKDLVFAFTLHLGTHPLHLGTGSASSDCTCAL